MDPIVELEKTLAKLPGLGRRSASRAALALVREKDRLLKPLAEALDIAAARVVCCSKCGAFTVSGNDPCVFCTDQMRDSKILCVVEEPADISSIESTGAFRGRYHSLGGKLAPARHMGPEKL
ncbi:MAG: toprim domain-containing protein, partial [Kiritimatiellae bacterium]|nr:toprim domain-containing protein [Kiritimatiellia bacterium]